MEIRLGSTVRYCDLYRRDLVERAADRGILHDVHQVLSIWKFRRANGLADEVGESLVFSDMESIFLTVFFVNSNYRI